MSRVHVLAEVRCRSLSFVVVRCRSLSFVVVRCHSLLSGDSEMWNVKCDMWDIVAEFDGEGDGERYSEAVL
jgi:hypothetical protein